MKQNNKILLLLFLIIVFMAGLYVYVNQGLIRNDYEIVMEGMNDGSCPDLLVQTGNSYLLYNTAQPMATGINPISFNTLDDYVNHIEIQRANGQRCPVLHAQMENNTQGQDVYRLGKAPSYPPYVPPTENSLLSTQSNIILNPPPNPLDASLENPPYNQGQYMGFDPQGQDIGIFTSLDQVHKSTEIPYISDNPMDPNWGGAEYTRSQVLGGKYDYSTVGSTSYGILLTEVGQH